MKTIKQTYLVNSSLDEVWKALTDPKYIDEGWREYYLGPLKEYLEKKWLS